MRRVVAVAVAFAVLVGSPAGAQDSRFGASIEISLVNVDVIVTDRSGNHVRGLTASDFEIYEGGKLQPITNFAEFRGSGATRVLNAAVSGAPAEAPEEIAPPQKRTIIVFVDKIEVHGRQRKELFENMKQFLRRSVRRGDSVTVTSWTSGPRAIPEFTDDLAKLEATLDQIAADRRGAKRSEWDSIDFERAQLEWYYNVTSGGTAGSDPSMVGTAVSQYDATARVVLDVRQKARTLSTLVQAIGAAEGQKILVMLTNRFAANSGLEYTGMANKLAVNAEAQMEEMLRAAKSNGVRVYPLYAKIGDMDVNETASSRTAQPMQAAQSQTSLRTIETSSLMNIADETGGVAGTGIGDVGRLFSHIAEDLESYYSLAYRATETREGREKRLVVKVKNGAYRVRTRRDVIDTSGERRLRQRILATLLQPAHTAGIPVNVFLKKARVESGLLHLPLEIRFPMSALTLLPDGSKQNGGFSVYVAWAGAGTTSDITKRSQPLAVSDNELAAAKSRTITYEVEVAATRVVERFVVAIVDEVTQEIGLVRFDMPKPNAR